MVWRKYTRAIRVFCKKKANLEQSFSFLQACGYDRDDERCKVRIHTSVTAYATLSDTKLAVELWQY